MPSQRWYAGKAREPQLRLVAVWDLPDPHTDRSRALVSTLLVADDGAEPVTLYQVPVVARLTASVDPDHPHVIGSPEPGTTLIDGPFDPSYTEALLRLVTRGGDGAGQRATARGVPASQLPPADYSARVLDAEQSNTSIIYRDDDGAQPVICKVFRQLHAGVNPDIELQTALAAAGSGHVPGAVGSVAGSWPDPVTGEIVEGSLAFAQEFLPGVEDAFRVALHAASGGHDFTTRAHELGATTAEVHVALAELFGTSRVTPERRDSIIAAWSRRLTIAAAEVPSLGGTTGAIEAVYERAARAPWPDLQRVHGDYHLGQVLLTPSRGWVLLDFEGEPMRPMSERLLPDLAIRDVAGALRSFDYIAGAHETGEAAFASKGAGPSSVRQWADAARAAFLEGYATASGVDLAAHAALMDALELDKAVYEAIYETRNRPDWVGIPLAAIDRLIRPGGA